MCIRDRVKPSVLMSLSTRNFFKWMEEKGLVDRDISTEGFTNDYLPAQ